MRQAGRILPEYRAVREKWTLTDISQNPELAIQVTLQPLRRFPLDAAILFADIMTPLIAVGVPITIVDNVGPVVASPVKSKADVDMIRPIEPEFDVAYVTQTISAVRREIGPDQAVIGFAGAPFTLASYLIEGKSSRSFARTKALMYGQPAVWHALMERLTAITIGYLQAQQQAGADILQLFDSWVGALSPADYREFVQPYTRRIITESRTTGAPFIHFGTGTATLLADMATDGADVIGVDWRMPLDAAWEIIGTNHAIQGNLDPTVLLGPVEHIRKSALAVLEAAGGKPGHIFNLGHGLLPETPVDNVSALVDFVLSQPVPIHATTTGKDLE